MRTRILLMLLGLGVLSTVMGCYDEPSRYDNRHSYQGAGPPSYRESTTEQEREYRRQRRQERAQERAYQQDEWERQREARPDWLR